MLKKSSNVVQAKRNLFLLEAIEKEHSTRIQPVKHKMKTLFYGHLSCLKCTRRLNWTWEEKKRSFLGLDEWRMRNFISCQLVSDFSNFPFRIRATNSKVPSPVTCTAHFVCGVAGLVLHVWFSSALGAFRTFGLGGCLVSPLQIRRYPCKSRFCYWLLT